MGRGAPAFGAALWTHLRSQSWFLSLAAPQSHLALEREPSTPNIPSPRGFSGLAKFPASAPKPWLPKQSRVNQLIPEAGAERGTLRNCLTSKAGTGQEGRDSWDEGVSAETGPKEQSESAAQAAAELPHLELIQRVADGGIKSCLKMPKDETQSVI